MVGTATMTAAMIAMMTGVEAMAGTAMMTAMAEAMGGTAMMTGVATAMMTGVEEAMGRMTVTLAGTGIAPPLQGERSVRMVGIREEILRRSGCSSPLTTCLVQGNSVVGPIVIHFCSMSH